MAIALYARKSVERENSVSCQSQLEYCMATLKPDERKQKILEFVDNGYSGANTNRDGFIEMMKLVESGKISKIIVYRLDRISRSLSDFLGILEKLKKHRVAFVSSQESFDTASPYGEMIVKLLMVFAEFERQSIIERVTQAYAYRSELGIFMGGKVPYGFTLAETSVHGVKTKMLKPERESTEHIKYIFEAYSVSGVSLRRVMDGLLKENFLPTDGGSWSTAKISTIIKNPIYVKADNSIFEYLAKKNIRIINDVSAFDGTRGVQIYGKTKHSAEDWSDMKAVVMPSEGIVSSDIWLACQKKIEVNKRVGNSLSNHTSWLGGRIACKKCGRTMTVTKGGKRADGSQTRYFSCTGKSLNRICTGPEVTVYADSIEDMVYTLNSQKLASLKACRKTVSQNNAEKINAHKNRISAINAEQEKLVSLMLRSDVGYDMLDLLNNKAKKLSEEKNELLEKIEALEDSETESVNVINLSEKWTDADFEEKRAVASLLIDRIYISEDGTTEVVWNI
jgi:DNA invertase Pin-like site-specific DNA recombinase